MDPWLQDDIKGYLRSLAWRLQGILDDAWTAVIVWAGIDECLD